MSYESKKTYEDTMPELTQILCDNYSQGKFNYKFNPKGIFYYVFGAWSLYFGFQLGIGWLFESMITGDVWLYHLFSDPDIKFGKPNAFVVILIPIGLFLAKIYVHFTDFFIGFFILHTKYFFKILDRKIDWKYNYTPNPWLNLFLWAFIVVSGGSALLLLTTGLPTLLEDDLTGKNVLFLSWIVLWTLCPFVAYFLKRSGIKELWLFLIGCIVYISTTFHYVGVKIAIDDILTRKTARLPHIKIRDLKELKFYLNTPITSNFLEVFYDKKEIDFLRREIDQNLKDREEWNEWRRKKHNLQ